MVGSRRQLPAARLAVAILADRSARAVLALRRRPVVVAAHEDGRQVSATGLAEVVTWRDGRTAGGAGVGRSLGLLSGHDQVLGRTSLARSTSAIRCRRSAAR